MQKVKNVVRKQHGACGSTAAMHTAESIQRVRIQDLFSKVKVEDKLEELKENPSLYRRYLGLSENLKKLYMDFMTGNRSLPLTYDPFFKKMFNPDIYPERLSEFISTIIGEKVTVKSVLSNDDSVLPTNAMLIMDIIVELEDGSIANVEIQRIGYAFAAERMSCYSSDLVIRQYSRAKGVKGAKFTYKDLKKVYTIVLFEESMSAFKDEKLGGAYRHHGHIVFDTGLEIDLLQEYFLVALDVFNESKYSEERSRLNAWLSLLTADTVDDLERLVSDYPWMGAVCVDMAEYLHKPEEVLTMFSDALRILDDNTAQYMVDEMQKEIDEKVKILIEKDNAIAEKDNAIAEKDNAIAEKDNAIAEKDNVIAEKDAEIERLRLLLAEKQ